MRQVLALCITLVFALGLAGAALAQGSQQPSGGYSSPSSSAPSSSSPSSGSSTDTQKSTAPSGGTTGKSDATKPGSAAGKPADKAAGSARGHHKMMGEVTKIDSAKGMVTVKTDEGDMDLHFPPSALQGIKEGDRVEVQLAVRPAGAAGKPAAGKSSTAPKTDDASKGSGKAPASSSAPQQQPKTQ